MREFVVDYESERLSLICRVRTRLCALPLERVGETMRPLPIEPISGSPHFVAGLAIIRGNLVPVVDAAKLIGAEESRPARFVTVKAGDHQVALAVDGVLGVRRILSGSLHDLPPLLRDSSSEVVAAIGTLDAELLLVLHTTRLVPEAFWSGLDTGKAAS